MYNKEKSAKEVCAVINHSDEVLWSRGGSSSSPRLMVYDSQKKAERARLNYWIKQLHKEDTTKVKKIYG